MPNRSITKAMLEDRALGQCFSTRGREIKLQYNIFSSKFKILWYFAIKHSTGDNWQVL